MVCQREEQDVRAMSMQLNKEAKLQNMSEMNRDFLLAQMQLKADKKTQVGIFPKPLL